MISATVKSGFRLNSKVKDKKVDAELQVLIVYGDASVLSSAAPGEAASEFCLFIEGEWFWVLSDRPEFILNIWKHMALAY